MDKGYDGEPIHALRESRSSRPVIALAAIPAVKAGEHELPTCDHGEWVFAGADAKRQASKWRWPTFRVQARVQVSQGVPAPPADPVWDRAVEVPLRQRISVERGFGRLKTDWGLLPLRVRRIARVALHASLTILAQLASALLITRDT